MSQLRVNSIKGLNVPATGPQIDIGNTGDISLNNANLTNVNDATVTTANITTNNVTTENVTTLNVTNSMDLRNANQFIVPTGTTGERPSSPNVGTIRYNTSTGKPEFWNGTTWKNFTIQRFTEEITSGSSWSVPAGVNSVEVMVVAGGGSGGSGTGGGGGAGGVVYATALPVTPGGTVSYSVGNGGPGGYQGRGNNGQNSTFGTITANGGGGGGTTYPPSRGGGRPGGSGGGGAQYPSGRYGGGNATQPGTPVAGAVGYGRNGERGRGGGGGAGGAGSGNTGGPGVTISVGENQYTVGGGGRGQSNGPTPGGGPPGGGGPASGSRGQSGGARQGGGGGAGWDYGSGRSGAGGSGLIVVSYLN